MRLWLATPALGVLLDCGRREKGANPKSDDDWWLDLYVMLSRAPRSEDLLLMRAPDVEFLLRGPPAALKEAPRKFAARTKACRKTAQALAAELVFQEFLPPRRVSHT